MVYQIWNVIILLLHHNNNMEAVIKLIGDIDLICVNLHKVDNSHLHVYQTFHWRYQVSQR